MKTWMLRVNEYELRCLIDSAATQVHVEPTPENSARLHDLVKRLNKDTPEIDGDPRPEETVKPVAETNSQQGWG